MIAVREGTAADRDFVIDTARRFASFGPPPWRPELEVVAGKSDASMTSSTGA
jgi:hypothetical protein